MHVGLNKYIIQCILLKGSEFMIFCISNVSIEVDCNDYIFVFCLLRKIKYVIKHPSLP